MNSNMIVLVEVILVFVVVFGWGLNELRQLRKYKRGQDMGSDESGEENN